MKKIFLLCLALFMPTISVYGDEVEVKNTIQSDNKQETRISDNKPEESTVDWGPYMRELERRIKETGILREKMNQKWLS